MKFTIKNISRFSLAALLIAGSMSSCTKNFEDYNKSNTGLMTRISKEMVRTLLLSSEMHRCRSIISPALVTQIPIKSNKT